MRVETGPRRDTLRRRVFRQTLLDERGRPSRHRARGRYRLPWRSTAPRIGR